MDKELIERLPCWADDAAEGRRIIGAASDIRQAATQGTADNARLEAMASLLSKAIGDITALLIMANRERDIEKYTAPYVEAVNAHDARAILEGKAS
jgi:hypothetical protein